jgi:hypothetical protein
MTSALFFAWGITDNLSARELSRTIDAELQPSTANGELLNREPFQFRSVEAIDRSKIGQRG